MSEEYRRLKNRYTTINDRVKKLRDAKGVIESVIVGAEAEQRALQLEMDALRLDGDGEFKEKLKK